MHLNFHMPTNYAYVLRQVKVSVTPHYWSTVVCYFLHPCTINAGDLSHHKQVQKRWCQMMIIGCTIVRVTCIFKNLLNRTQMSAPCLCVQACFNNAFLKLLLCVRLRFIKIHCKSLSLADGACNRQHARYITARRRWYDASGCPHSWSDRAFDKPCI